VQKKKTDLKIVGPDDAHVRRRVHAEIEPAKRRRRLFGYQALVI
jgi:hypothetical protein